MSRYAWLIVITVACTNRDAAKLCDQTTATCTCPNGSAFCADCSSHPQFVSKCDAPHGGVCCTADADGTCECRSAAACNAGESAVTNCGFTPGGGFNPGGGIGGDSDSGGDGGDAFNGDAFNGDTAGCTSIGFCRSGFDSCTCGSSCVHFGDGGFTCGYPCTTSSDCIGRSEPVTGVPFTRCSTRVVTPQVTYDSYCLP